MSSGTIVGYDFRNYAINYEQQYRVVSWLKKKLGFEKWTLSSFLERAKKELDENEKAGVLIYDNPQDRVQYFKSVTVKVNSIAQMVKWIQHKKLDQVVSRQIEQVEQRVLAARYRLVGSDEKFTYDPDIDNSDHMDNWLVEEIKYDREDTASLTLSRQQFKLKADDLKKSLPTQIFSRIQENRDKLKQLALKWKQKNIFWKNKPLDPLQENQLDEASRYVNWTEWVLKNPRYLNDFFKSALQDYNPVSVLITCPKTYEEIRFGCCHTLTGGVQLDARGDHMLSFALESFKENPVKYAGKKFEFLGQTRYGKKRILTLPFYKGTQEEFEADYRMKRYNILDEKNMLSFCGSMRMTVKKFFELRRQVNEFVLDIIPTPFGFMNSNPVKLGYKDEKTGKHVVVVDLSSRPDNPNMPKDPKWYLKLPPTCLAYKSPLADHYGTDRIDGKTSFLKAGATRGKLSINEDGSEESSSLGAHGFLRFYFARKDKGYYHVVDTGKFAEVYAVSWWDTLVLFCATVLAVLMYSDPNGCYSHRQWALLPLFPSPEKMDCAIENLRQSYLKMLYFQFIVENCSSFVEGYLQQTFENFPKLYSLNLFSGKGGMHILDRYLSKFKRCHWFIQFLAVLPILIPACAWRWLAVKVTDQEGKEKWEYKSVLKSVFQKIYEYKDDPDKENFTNPTIIFDKKEVHKQIDFAAKLEITFGFPELNLTKQQSQTYEQSFATA